MKINDLKHYPRFVFNFPDKCFSTCDLDEFKHIKNDDHDFKVNSFKTGEIIKIKRDDKSEISEYRISKIDIRDIRYDTEEKLYGVWEDDCTTISGKEKFELMAIFIFLEDIDK